MAETETDPPAPPPGPHEGPHEGPNPHENRRQVLYWRLLARLSGAEEQPALESAGVAATEDAGLPAALMDPGVTVDTLVQRFPGLAAEFEALSQAAAGDAAPEDPPAPDGGDVGEQEVRRAALMSKLLLNVFSTGSGDVTAERLSAWQSDAGWLEQAFGHAPGSLRGRPRDGGLGGSLGELEGDLVRRMRLREVLADDDLASRLSPSMSLVEQLLRDKDHLSGTALANAKALIRRYVDEVAEVLRTRVSQASAGTVDRSVPPKRVFRNLDLQRTIWKNLPNWNPEDQRLYVDRLFYRRTAKRIEPARLIVVVDQSGSMVDAMVNCTILASIFTGLPKVDVHLVAYDTRALDLTPWVHDPFETLLRTRLGGGTDGRAALEQVRPKVADPRNTVVVWISDFFEWNERPVFGGMEALHRSGVRFIPVGSVTSGGRQSVNPWFRQRFKDMGTPVLSGHIDKLVFELKNFLG
ncbi:VWA domain-containing protein [Nocardiopsis halophila]|uniref:VWA domain-containing protein n=1 Tax=Nocardiopsis halophila TaxID=141692 RepID=UPI00034B6221|nr:VWA domain-containing protein [Nocardiopsis halophila]